MVYTSIPHSYVNTNSHCIHDAAALSRRKWACGRAPLRHRRARLAATRAPGGLRAPLCRVPLALRTAARGARPVGGTRHFSRNGKLEDLQLNRITVELIQFQNIPTFQVFLAI